MYIPLYLGRSDVTATLVASETTKEIDNKYKHSGAYGLNCMFQLARAEMGHVLENPPKNQKADTKRLLIILEWCTILTLFKALVAAPWTYK